MNNVVSLSGGKDSTAMLLMMIERGEPIHSVVFFDTGWEFPQMHEHINLLEKRTGLSIQKIKPPKPFSHWMIYREIRRRSGPSKGEIRRIGFGWPAPRRRWCTREKCHAINRFIKPISNPIQCVGFSADEKKRTTSSKYPARFPLQEYGITGADALAYCYAKGYGWGGLYEHFERVSCFCCPLQRIGGLRTLRRHFPNLWQRMLDMENEMPPGTNRGFKNYKTVHDLDRRFTEEERQIKL